MTANIPSLEIASLGARFAADPGEPERVLHELHRRIAESPSGIWISRAPLAAVLAELAEAARRLAGGEALPLFGVPYAVKDNIDVAGVPTTAGCPAFAYTPAASAPVVERLKAAGAVFLGKTNLDQFATGLVGVRSPYGVCHNAFDPEYIAGGSSSGSAVAVAKGLVSFALGTDTAGSGRVPAALNNIVGLKPTCGRLSSRGVVPACRTLDSVSIFAGTCRDVSLVLDACGGFDPADPFSKVPPERLPGWSERIRLGVPRKDEREFFGDREASRLYDEAVARAATSCDVREIDFEPFRLVAELLYGAPWVAERLHAAGDLLAKNPDALHPVVRKILEGARAFDALAAFRAEYRLLELRREAEAVWRDVDALLLPTTPTTYRIADVERQPIELNRRLGHYTNFVNLLDLAAVAVPAGFRSDGQPLGVTFVGRSWYDQELSSLASRFHASLVPEPTIGATGARIVEPLVELAGKARSGRFLLAVAGAHLTGQPLNHQLTSRGATLVKTCRTAPNYRFYALLGTKPPKPGLFYDADFAGEGIEVEVWSLGPAAFAEFVDEVPPPLAIGTLVLDDGTSVNGFVCEPRALSNATEITSYGSWRKYRASSS